jgi:hypothetical protein
VVPRAVPRSLEAPDLYNASNRVITPPLDLGRLRREDAQVTSGPSRIGVIQEFGYPAEGLWSQMEDGGWLWTMAAEAPGAKAMRIRITDWNPPPGAELILFNPDNQRDAVGPITGSRPWRSDTLWTPYIYSDVVHLEYYLPRQLSRDGPEKTFQVDALVNRYRFGFGDLDKSGDREVECHLDVSCYPEWQSEADGVGGLSFFFTPYVFGCSGAMYNRIPSDWTPMFATAEHCGVTEDQAEYALVEWFYQTETCDGDPPDVETFPQTPGVVLLMSDPTTDYALVGLSYENTGGVVYVGWDPNYWFPGSGTGIHHPGSSYKRISFGTKVLDTQGCVDGEYPLAWGMTFNQGDGELESGSSGSPIFDSERRTRGVLSCTSTSCETPFDVAEYGRLDETWDSIERFLVPTDPIYVDAGYDGSEYGTESQPFDTVIEGFYVVIEGSDVHIESGSYDEWITFNKAMTLHARGGTVTIGQ